MAERAAHDQTVAQQGGPGDLADIGLDKDGNRWAVHIPSGDIFVMHRGSNKWVFGTTRSTWDARGRKAIFGDDNLIVRAKEIEARRPWEEKQRRRAQNTLRMGFGPAGDKPEIDFSIHGNPVLDEMLNVRTEKKTGWQQLGDTLKTAAHETNEFLQYRPYLRDHYTKLWNRMRMRVQDAQESRDWAQRDIDYILQPFGYKSPYTPPGVAEQIFQKIAQTEDLVARSERSIGTKDEIAGAERALQRAADAATGLKGKALKAAMGDFATAREKLDRLNMKQEVPGGWTTEQLKDQLKAYYEAAKPYPAIAEALKRDVEVNRRMLREGIARGELKAELLTRTGRYYPHEVQDFDEEIAKVLARLPRDMRKPFMAWTKRAYGSNKVIDFDYREAMERHLFRQYLAHHIVDFADEMLPVYDILPDLVKDPDKYNKVFSISGGMGRVAKLSELKHGDQFKVEGKPYVIYRFARGFGVTGGAPSTAAEALALDTARSLANPHLIPAETLPAYEYDTWRQDLQNAARFVNTYSTWWKRTTIMAGGVSTRFNNSMGDTWQEYLQDAMALPNNLKIPRVWRIMSKSVDELTPEYANDAELKDWLNKQRALSGSTFFGQEERQLNREMRNMSPAERRLFWLRHPFKALDRLSNIMEQWPRVSLAMRIYDEIKAGREYKSKVFPTEGLTPEEQIGVITRNTFVDPQAVSEPYQKMLRRRWLPFVTWYHRTMDYHARYMWNNKMNAAMKIGVPLFATWYWNNWLHRDRERYVSDFVRDNMLHVTIPDPKPDDPNHNTVFVFPMGGDLLWQMLYLPQLSERVAQVANGEVKNPFQAGWSDVATTLGNAMVNAGSRVIDLSPVIQAFQAAASNQDPRTGRKVMDDDLWKDKARRERAMGWYLVQKIIPVFDRFKGYAMRELRKDPTWLDRLVGSQGGATRKAVQDIVANWLNPMRALQYDLDTDPLKRLRHDSAAEKEQEGVAHYDLEEAISKTLTGEDKNAIQAWRQANPEQVPGKVDTLAAIRAYTQYALEHAPNDAERKRLQDRLDKIDKLAAVRQFKALPKVGQAKVLQNTRNLREGKPARERGPGLFGEVHD